MTTEISGLLRGELLRSAVSRKLFHHKILASSSLFFSPFLTFPVLFILASPRLFPFLFLSSSLSHCLLLPLSRD